MVEREQREFLRIDDMVPVTYSKIMPPPPGKTKEGKRENIGGGGIKLISEEVFPVETVLKLQIDLPDTLKPTSVSCLGKVVWTNPVIEEGKSKHAMGIAYLDIPESERKKIINYVFGKQRMQRLMRGGR